MGEDGTNGCAVYLTAAQCEEYGDETDGTRFNRVFTTENDHDKQETLPKGCLWNGHNNQIYYNPHATGAGQSKYKPVCNGPPGGYLLFKMLKTKIQI